MHFKKHWITSLWTIIEYFVILGYFWPLSTTRGLLRTEISINGFMIYPLLHSMKKSQLECTEISSNRDINYLLVAIFCLFLRKFYTFRTKLLDVYKIPAKNSFYIASKFLRHIYNSVTLFCSLKTTYLFIFCWNWILKLSFRMWIIFVVWMAKFKFTKLCIEKWWNVCFQQSKYAFMLRYLFLVKTKVFYIKQ